MRNRRVHHQLLCRAIRLALHALLYYVAHHEHGGVQPPADRRREPAVPELLGVRLAVRVEQHHLVAGAHLILHALGRPPLLELQGKRVRLIAAHLRVAALSALRRALHFGAGLLELLVSSAIILLFVHNW